MIEDALHVHRPVGATPGRAPCTQVSHDPTLRQLVTLRDGRTMTAVQLQMEYFEQARKFVEDRFGSDVDDVRPATCWSAGSRCSPGWSATRCRCRRRARLGRQAASCSRATASATAWTGTPPRLQLVDLQYADVRPEKGLYHRLVGPRPVRAHRSPTPRSGPPWTDPPEDTRAYFRGRCLDKYADDVAAASLGLGDLRRARPRSLQRVPDPGTAARHPGTTSKRCSTMPHRGGLVRAPCDGVWTAPLTRRWIPQSARRGDRRSFGGAWLALNGSGSSEHAVTGIEPE